MAKLTRSELNHAFGLAPEEAIAYLKRKNPQVTWNWYDMHAAAHSKAFTVAKALKMDVLTGIQEHLLQALEEGMSQTQFIDTMRLKLKKLGWWGKQELIDFDSGEVQTYSVDPWRLRTVYRTNMHTAFASARYKSMLEDDRIEYLEYCSQLDSATRPAHAAMDGMTYRKNDPIWQAIMPPNGFGCRCYIRGHSQYSVDKKGLNVRESKGSISNIEQRIGTENGKPIMRNGITYQLPNDVVKFDDHGNRIKSFTPDAGWSSNAGSQFWLPSLEKHLNSASRPIAKQYVKDLMESPVFNVMSNEQQTKLKEAL